MGFFDKLGGKNKCSFCDGKIGMLDKTLSDGYLCKECKKKLSKYYSVSKNNTVEYIGMQLKDREEENAKRLDNIKPNKIFGDFGVILIDEENKVFAALPDTIKRAFGDKTIVNSIDDIRDMNPDVISFSQVKDVRLDLNVSQRELKKTVDGEEVSYDPKHFMYMCGFTMYIDLDHPYLDSIYIPLSDGNVHIKTTEPRKRSSLLTDAASWFLDIPQLKWENRPAITCCDSLEKAVWGNPTGLPDYSYGFRVTPFNKDAILRYTYYLAMAGEIRDALMPDKKA